MTSRAERQREDTEVVGAVSILMKSKLCRLLAKWHLRTEQGIRKRQAQARADRHYHHGLKCDVFTAWQEYHRTLLRKALLKRQCVLFERSRLLSSCCLKWRLQVLTLTDMHTVTGSYGCSSLCLVDVQVGGEAEVCPCLVALESCTGSEGFGCLGCLHS